MGRGEVPLAARRLGVPASARGSGAGKQPAAKSGESKWVPWSEWKKSGHKK